MASRFSKVTGERIRSESELAFALREHIEQACPFDLTFAPLPKDATVEERQKLQRCVAAQFEIWAQSWIRPIADELSERAGRELTPWAETYAHLYARGERHHPTPRLRETEFLSSK